MKEPIISDLDHVTEEMIKALERWLKNVKSGKWAAGRACPFNASCFTCVGSCNLLFENLSEESCPCPCSFFGQDATVLAFTIICDVWPEYYVKP